MKTLMENLNFPKHEIDSLEMVLKEGGLNLWSKFKEEISTLHLIERGYLPSEKNKLVEVLKKNTEMDYSSILNLINRCDSIKSHFPSYSIELNEKLNRINQDKNVKVPFEWIGRGSDKKLIGIVDEGKTLTIYDRTGVHPIKVGDILKMDYSINWNHYVKLNTPQQKYIVDKVKELKSRIL